MQFITGKVARNASKHQPHPNHKSHQVIQQVTISTISTNKNNKISVTTAIIFVFISSPHIRCTPHMFFRTCEARCVQATGVYLLFLIQVQPFNEGMESSAKPVFPTRSFTYCIFFSHLTFQYRVNKIQIYFLYHPTQRGLVRGTLHFCRKNLLNMLLPGHT